MQPLPLQTHMQYCVVYDTALCLTAAHMRRYRQPAIEDYRGLVRLLDGSKASAHVLLSG